MTRYKRLPRRTITSPIPPTTVSQTNPRTDHSHFLMEPHTRPSGDGSYEVDDTSHDFSGQGTDHNYEVITTQQPPLFADTNYFTPGYDPATNSHRADGSVGTLFFRNHNYEVITTQQPPLFADTNYFTPGYDPATNSHRADGSVGTLFFRNQPDTVTRNLHQNPWSGPSAQAYLPNDGNPDMTYHQSPDPQGCTSGVGWRSVAPPSKSAVLTLAWS